MNISDFLTLIIGYFILLYLISFWVSRKKGSNLFFFSSGKNNKWYIIAVSMIGTTLSGITFISVPGKVATMHWGYLIFILGNILGILFVIFVLLPLYYQLKVISIYSYIGVRFNLPMQKIAASLFLVARSVATAGRLYLILMTLHFFVFEPMGISFITTSFICIFFIWLYTFRGGLGTIIWTDLLQTCILLSAVILSFYYLNRELGFNFGESLQTIFKDPKSQLTHFNDFFTNTQHTYKQFIGGLVIGIAAVGADQDLMQKNLALPDIREAQKEMLTYTGVFLIINICFLCIGVLLYLYAEKSGIPTPANSDFLYPDIALNHLPLGAGVFFILGLTAATFASTDASLTAMTTSFCIDILDFEKKENEKKLRFIRSVVHAGFSGTLFFIGLLLYTFNDEAMVITIFKLTGYTYGPLLSLFLFGLWVKKRTLTHYRSAILIAILSPVLTFFIQFFLSRYRYYEFGYDLIVLNTLLSFIGVYLISSKKTNDYAA